MMEITAKSSKQMQKQFISANQLLNDSFALAEQIYLSGYRPTMLVAVWRGGMPIGIAIHEYLDFLDQEVEHMPIYAKSYMGIGKNAGQPELQGLDFVVQTANKNSQILLIDDVFDTGKTMQSLCSALVQNSALTINQFKIATPWYKPTQNITGIEPDFYLYKTDNWLVFPHELKGLTKAEIAKKSAELPSRLSSSIKED